MTKQCNIDAKGKFVRLAAGLVLLISAIVLAVLTFLEVIEGTWPWVLVGSFSILGAFAVYEGRAGWCIARAMGIKTWI